MNLSLIESNIFFQVAHLFAQIVLAMQYVHQNQILHRDLKSQNIFLTRSLDHVKIGDFGISKILSSKSKALTVVGTPCYISPELCEGRPYNTKWAPNSQFKTDQPGRTFGPLDASSTNSVLAKEPLRLQPSLL